MKKIVLLITPSREHTRGLLNGIVSYAHIQNDWSFLRPITYRMPKSRQYLLPILKEIQPDGIIMREPREMEAIINLGIPTVAFTYSREEFPNIVNVVTENGEIGEMGAEHLIKCGFQNFAFCGFDDWWWSRLRRDMFAKTVTKAGYETCFYKLPRAKIHRTWYKEVHIIADWLKNLPKPIGLMACNDDRGELVLEACKIAGLRVPDDVAVLGVDNDKLICSLSTPPLSSIALNVEKSGYKAAALLNTMMRERKPREEILSINPIQVIQRQSTDILAINDSEVVEAIRYIRNHVTSAIQVNDVANSVSLSRRVLEKRFRKVLKHSIRDEIQHVRIERIIYLLSETNMTISEISQMMNFPSTANFSRYFYRAKGISPAAYRKKYVKN
jgi:LacI family transcriptional regulator